MPQCYNSIKETRKKRVLTISILSTKQEYSSYQAAAIGRYLDERDLESPWSPLPLGDQAEDNRSFHRDRELRVAIDSCSIENNSSNPLSNIVERLEEANPRGTSRSTGWIRVGKVEHCPPQFTDVAKVNLVGNNPLVPEPSNPVPVPHGGERIQPVPNFVDFELEYTAEAGWMKVAVWSR